MEGAQRRGVPGMGGTQTGMHFSGRVKLLPARSDITMPINEKINCRIIFEVIFECRRNYVHNVSALDGFDQTKQLEVEEKSLTSTYGKFYAEPFERGFGQTIGNTLRRILLSSLMGHPLSPFVSRGFSMNSLPSRGYGRRNRYHIKSERGATPDQRWRAADA